MPITNVQQFGALPWAHRHESAIGRAANKLLERSISVHHMATGATQVHRVGDRVESSLELVRVILGLRARKFGLLALVVSKRSRGSVLCS